MSIASEISRLQSARADIQDALMGKGVIEAGIHGFDDFATDIESIESGASYPIYEGSGTYTVEFYGYRNEVLKVQYVSSGNNATPPTVSDTKYLTFNEWIGNYTNVTKNEKVFAHYDTIDGHSYIFFDTFNKTTPTIYINKSNTSTLTIYDDDTNSVLGSSSSSGNINISLSLSKDKSYVFRIECSGGYYFGNGTSTTPIFGTAEYKLSVKRIYTGSSCTSSGSYMSYNGYYNIEEIVISSTITSIGTSSIDTCRSMFWCIIPTSVTSISAYNFRGSGVKYLIVPSSVTSIGINCFAGTYISFLKLECNINFSITLDGSNALGSINIPSNITSYASNSFRNCTSLQTLTVPSSVTAIGAYTFQYYAGSEIIFESTTPPTIESTTFNNLASWVVFYVPDSSVSTYKSATNWATYSSRIYSINSR